MLARSPHCRTLSLLATSSLVAGVLASIPVTISLPPRDAAVEPRGLGGISERASALARLGLSGDEPYSAPLVVTWNHAAAEGGSGGGDGGAGGGGGSGGNSGPGGGDNSGPGGSGGDNSGPGGDSDSGDSGDSELGGPSSGTDDPRGGASGGFGGVEQVGPDLSRSEEAEAIESGWQ